MRNFKEFETVTLATTTSNMQEGQATVKDKKIHIKQVRGAVPITLACFDCAGSCVCALCSAALAHGPACAPVCPASESFFCFNNKGGGYASKGVVHVFHEWCLQEYFSGRPLLPPLISSTLPSFFCHYPLLFNKKAISARVYIKVHVSSFTLPAHLVLLSLTLLLPLLSSPPFPSPSTKGKQ